MPRPAGNRRPGGIGFAARLFGALGFRGARSASETPLYDAAGTGRRAATWSPSSVGVNAAIFASADTLRARSRDAVRKNAWAANALDSFVANAVGTGVKPQSLAEDAEFRAAAQNLWLRWTDEADAAGLLDFYGLQALVCRAVLEGGECLVRLRARRPEDGLSVPLQLQVLEPEHLPLGLTRDLPSGNAIRAGIEFDRIGRRVAYWLYPQHPGEAAGVSSFGAEPVPVPADQVLHVFRPLRPGQVRGQPWMAQTLVRLWELDQYDDAELSRKKTAAMKVGYVTKPNDDSDPLGADGAPLDDSGAPFVTWEPGTMTELLPGEDVKFFDPVDVGPNYAAFMRQQLQAIATGLGITYEQLTGDLTGVNFSSIRAGLIEARRRMEQFIHAVLVHQLCRPVWSRWMRDAVLAGALSAPGFLREPRRYAAVKWIPQGWQWVDPLKEVQATLKAIGGGLTSRSEAISQQGYDAETVDAEIAADKAREARLGLKFDAGDARSGGADAATDGEADAAKEAA